MNAFIVCFVSWFERNVQIHYLSWYCNPTQHRFDWISCIQAVGGLCFADMIRLPIEQHRYAMNIDEVCNLSVSAVENATFKMERLAETFERLCNTGRLYKCERSLIPALSCVRLQYVPSHEIILLHTVLWKDVLSKTYPPKHLPMCLQTVRHPDMYALVPAYFL